MFSFVNISQHWTELSYWIYSKRCYKDYLFTRRLPWYLHETRFTNLS